ncbi:aminoacyl-tRNA hydrolase [Calditerricola satsumensis]|uniref:Peptidyl-tRNA hydrolase n=1 Tax=Calditerricola satsumensis TaxID=373054 RepID=A0A8J3BFC5_9BACI|nr:aminoacyl-tRNA hydrolase [Calditerricola satsumensis]GGK06611.1 peptidyl-tRNA hydrolase [Calditerricola satsumensis]
MKLIVGLGNPGPAYAATRHNVGFWVIDRLARTLRISVDKAKWKGLVGEGCVDGQKVLLLKPQTYMNASGESVAEAVRFHKLNPEAILVIYDDMDLPLGTLRVRMKGSDGGHRGLRSIIAHLGTQEIPRIRIGIGRPAPGVSVTDHVLSPFAPEEREAAEAAAVRAAEAAAAWITEPIDRVMNRFNR